MTNQQEFLCDVCHDPACPCSARGLTASQYKELMRMVHGLSAKESQGSASKSGSIEPEKSTADSLPSTGDCACNDPINRENGIKCARHQADDALVPSLEERIRALFDRIKDGDSPAEADNAFRLLKELFVAFMQLRVELDVDAVALIALEKRAEKAEAERDTVTQLRAERDALRAQLDDAVADEIARLVQEAARALKAEELLRAIIKTNALENQEGLRGMILAEIREFLA